MTKTKKDKQTIGEWVLEEIEEYPIQSSDNINSNASWDFTTTDSSNSIYIGGGSSGNHSFTATNQKPILTIGPSSNSHYYQPYITGTGGITFNSHDKYRVFRLPESSMPNKVYVSGRLVTVGIIGSDVQAAYGGGNKLIFAPGELEIIQYNDRLTVSIDYGDALYHYNVITSDAGAVETEEGSTVVVTKLVSKVMQR